ncbi:apolipoprotein N-acyltransferase [Achromobacter aloeverae]
MMSFVRFPRSPRAAAVLVAGAAQALTFAPGPLPDAMLAPLQIFVLAVLAWQVMTAAGPRRAFWFGWLFNTACYTVGLYWLFISMHRYGDLAAPLAAGGVFLLSAFLALFPAAACALARWLAPLPPDGDWKARLRAALAFAVAWGALEWVRGNLWTGFPWLNIGYAHVDSPFAGWAPLLGLYGIVLIAAFAAAALAVLWQPRKNAARDARLAVPAGLAVLLALGGWALGLHTWSQPTGAPLQVRLVQGNVGQSDKFDPALMEQGLIQHMNQASLPPPAGTPAPQLIVLPETVLPVFQDQLPPQVWDIWKRIAAERQATIIMGVPLHRVVNGKDRWTNSAIGFDGDSSTEAMRSGEIATRYDKQHLVPWGEFVPPGFRWFVDLLNIPLGDFDNGARWQAPFPVDGQRIALNICYEDLFGEELLPAIRPGPNGEAGASILLNISNLGWFGDSWALRQHLQIGRMRTLETARPMLAATNTGLTVAIDPRGRVQAALPSMTRAELATQVQGMSGLTPYTRTGNLPAELLIAIGLGALAARRPRGRRPD